MSPACSHRAKRAWLVGSPKASARAKKKKHGYVAFVSALQDVVVVTLENKGYELRKRTVIGLVGLEIW